MTGSPIPPGAPPPVRIDGETAVPIDITTVDVELALDAGACAARARAVVQFRALRDGHPMLDLVPPTDDVRLDGMAGPLKLHTVAVDHCGRRDITRLRVLEEAVRRGEEHALKLEYELPSKLLYPKDGGLDFGFFMTDIGRLSSHDRGFLERYCPANLEFDPFALTVRLDVTGADAPMRLHANGGVTPTAPRAWEAHFPSWYTASCPYLHVITGAEDEDYHEAEALHESGGRFKTVLVYARREELAREGLERTLCSLRALEDLLGPYPHDSLLVHVTDEGLPGIAGGAIDEAFRGMEYAGAIMTSLDAIPHELGHTWFGRYVLPADGNAGWIDEAFAQWLWVMRYPENYLPPEPLGLGSDSPYRRSTQLKTYEHGVRLLRALCRRVGERNGDATLMSVLRAILQRHPRRPITNADLESVVLELGGEPAAKLLREHVGAHPGRFAAATGRIVDPHDPDGPETRRPRMPKSPRDAAPGRHGSDETPGRAPIPDQGACNSTQSQRM